MDLLGSAVPIALSIATLVVVWRQWVTSHQNMVVDLFEHRYKIYEQVIASIRKFLTSEGNLRYVNAMVELQVLGEKAIFLFDADVVAGIRAISTDILRLQHAALKGKDTRLSDQEREDAEREGLVIFEAITKWHETFTDLCFPYMKLDDKLMKSPRQWLAERNRLRLALADKN